MTKTIKEAFFLYVEDDESNRKVMKLLIHKAMGVANLVIFEDSHNFLQRVKNLPSRPDIVLLDIQVKPYDGFEMLHMLRSDPDYKHLKVIALTASVMNEEIERLRQSGCDGAIGKPLSLSTFPSLITRIFNGETLWHIM